MLIHLTVRGSFLQARGVGNNCTQVFVESLGKKLTNNCQNYVISCFRCAYIGTVSDCWLCLLSSIVAQGPPEPSSLINTGCDWVTACFANDHLLLAMRWSGLKVNLKKTFFNIRALLGGSIALNHHHRPFK